MNKNGLNVLILASSSYGARRLTRLLEYFGHATRFYTLGSPAVQGDTPLSAEFDIMLIETSGDIELGVSAAATARLENDKIPIVSVSPDPGMDHLVRCFACGIDGHIDVNSPAAEFDRMIRWFVEKKVKMNSAAEKICVPPNFKTP